LGDEGGEERGDLAEELLRGRGRVEEVVLEEGENRLWEEA